MIERLVSALSAARDFVLGGTVTPGYITYKDLSVKKEKNNNNASKKKKGKKSGTDAAQNVSTNNNNNNDSAVSDAPQPSEGEKVTGVNDSTPSETTAPTETLDL